MQWPHRPWLSAHVLRAHPSEYDCQSVGGDAGPMPDSPAAWTSRRLGPVELGLRLYFTGEDSGRGSCRGRDAAPIANSRPGPPLCPALTPSSRPAFCSLSAGNLIDADLEALVAPQRTTSSIQTSASWAPSLAIGWVMPEQEATLWLSVDLVLF